MSDADGKLVTVRAADRLHFTPAGQEVLARATQQSIDPLWPTAYRATAASMK